MGIQAPPEAPEGAHPLKKDGPFILLNKRIINKSIKTSGGPRAYKNYNRDLKKNK
jgi:hypothetical protein